MLPMRDYAVACDSAYITQGAIMRGNARAEDSSCLRGGDLCDNAKLGVTPEQRLAMEIGSLCGWHVPGADPKTYEGRLSHGEPDKLSPQKTESAKKRREPSR